MGKPFYFLPYGIIVVLVTALLFIPIPTRLYLHYDVNRRKFCFALYVFSFLRIVGGYVATYRGGLALHISQNRAIVFPYKQMKSERKRFSFLRTFPLTRLETTVETGADYLLPVTCAVSVLRTYYLLRGGKISRLEQNLWLADGDVLRISCNIGTRFYIAKLIANMAFT